MEEMAAKVGETLRARGLTVATAESATGGLISHLFTNIPGSSDYFRGGVVAYANEAKIEVLGVKEESIARFGAVSPEVAEEMAEGVKRLLKADLALSDTGIAGPGGATPQKPVGLFYLGLAFPGGVRVKRALYVGSRLENKEAAAKEALAMLWEYLHAEESWEDDKKVVTVFLENAGEIALFKRSARVGTYQGCWGGVAGYLEEGVPPYTQALREIAEEAGLGPEEVALVKEGKPVVVIDPKLKRKWVVHPFRFQAKTRALKIDWEHTEVRWVEPRAIREHETVPGLWEAWQEVGK